MTLILQILNIIYRDYKPIKASSPWLNHLIFTGCYLIEISNTMLVVTQTETYNKSFRSDIKEHIFNIIPWLLSSGITLIIGTVFVKTLRLHRIYIKSKRFSLANMTYMSNKALGGSVILLVCVDLLICLIWTTADRLTITTVRKIQLLQSDEFPVVLVYDNFLSHFSVYWLILQNLWETVQLQTNWKLETCTKPDSEGIVTTDGPSQESNSTEAGSHGASTDTLTITVSQQSRSDHGSTTDPDDNLADHDQDLSPPSIPPTQQ